MPFAMLCHRDRVGGTVLSLCVALADTSPASLSQVQLEAQVSNRACDLSQVVTMLGLKCAAFMMMSLFQTWSCMVTHCCM